MTIHVAEDGTVTGLHDPFTRINRNFQNLNREVPVGVFRCGVFGECTTHMRDIKSRDGERRVSVCAGCEEFSE